MKINIKDVVKIRRVIESVQANEKIEISKVAHSYDDIHHLAINSEWELSTCITAKLMSGIKVKQQKAFVSSDALVRVCTEIMIERGSKGWFLTDYKVIDCDEETKNQEPGFYYTQETLLDKELKDYLMEKPLKFLSHYR